MEIASTEQPSNSPILREQFFGADAERGSMSAKLAVFAGSLIVAAGAVLGAGDYAHHHPLTKTEVAVSAGKGMLTAVRSLAVPEACYGVYQNDVTGAKATFDYSFTPFGLKIPTTLSASSTFNGNLTSKVCNPSMDLSLSYNKATNRYKLTLPAGSFRTDVYRTNPTVNAFTPDNGALMALTKNAENIINALPELQAHTTDGLMGKLDGYAELAADQTSTEACGPKAWDHLKPLYEKSLKAQMVNEAYRWAPDLKLTEQEIDVEVTGEFHPTNQYDKLLKETKPLAEKNGVNFVLPDPSKLVCTDSPGLQNDLDKLAGATKWPSAPTNSR